MFMSVSHWIIFARLLVFFPKNPSKPVIVWLEYAIRSHLVILYHDPDSQGWQKRLLDIFYLEGSLSEKIQTWQKTFGHKRYWNATITKILMEKRKIEVYPLFLIFGRKIRLFRLRKESFNSVKFEVWVPKGISGTDFLSRVRVRGPKK